MKHFIVFLALSLILSPVLAQDLTIKVGAYNNPPKIYVNESTGKVSGFHATIIEAIAQRQGWNLQYVTGSFNEGLDRLARGEIDVMVDVAYSEDRALLYDFNNESILDDWGVIYTKSGFEPNNIIDLEGKKIGVMRGSIHTTYFIELAKSFDVNIELVYAENYTEVFRMVMLGLADAGVVNRLFGGTSKQEYSLIATNIIFNPVQLRYAMPKGASLNNEIIKGLDESIIYLKESKNSIYYTALNQMFGEAYDIGPLMTVFYIIIGLIILIALFFIVYLYASRREIGLRLKVQTQLKESETRFYKTFEAAPIGILIFDNLGRIVDANPKCTEITGYSRHEFIGKNLMSIARLFKMDLKNAVSEFDKSLKGDQSPVEFKIIDSKGNEKNILISSAFIKEQKRLILLIDDITLRKESEARFKSIFDKAPIGILILDSKSTIIDANPKCTEITGYDKQQFIGKSLFYLAKILKFNLREVIKLFNELAKGNLNKSSELTFTNKKGKRIIINSTPSFIKEQKRMILLIEDINSRKEIEAALIKKEEEFRNIFETSPELIVVLDNKGKLLNMNGRLLEWAGFSKEDFIGKSILSMPLTSESKIRVMKAFAKRMMGQNVEPYEVEFVSRNKNIKIGLIRGSLIKDDKGKVTSDLAMISDITETKELESLKNNLVMLTTHDLKQPLMPILGYADLLKPMITDDKGKEYLKIITDSSYHMRDMINKIINLFKIEEGQLSFTMEVNDLSRLVNDVLNYKKSFIDLKRIKLINILGKNVKAKFDLDRIRDALINLIDNAIKFTSNKGTITIRTWAKKDKVYFSIKDTGIGLTREDMANLFKKFYQSKEGKAMGGSGIGLALVKKIIDAHKGDIKVKSIYGKGSEFIIELPIEIVNK